MANLPDKLVRIAATGSNANTRAELAQEETAFTNEANTPERDLLLTVAAHAIQNQAGYMPQKIKIPLPLASGQDDKVICTVQAQHHLMQMLRGLHSNLLPLWFEKIAENNQTIPHEMIPTLLDYGARKRKLAPYIREVLGERGMWLAKNADNRRWKWFTAQGGKKEAIQNRYESWSNHLKRMRKSKPEQALKLLTKSWSNLDAIMQVTLVTVMEDDLSAQDVPFLISCLEYEVTRDVAFKLLLRIDESGLKEEIQQKIEQLIHLKQVSNANEWSINFIDSPVFVTGPNDTLPNKSDLYKVRGYPVTPESILMMLPLSYWYEYYGATANDLISAASNSKMPELFYRVWEGIAIEADDTEFLYQLMLQVPHYVTSKLMKHLSQEQLMQLAIMRFNVNPVFSVSHNGVKILKAIKTIWNDDLIMVFLKSLENAFKTIPRPMLDKKMREALLKYAEWIPLSSYNYFENVIHINERGNLSEAETEQINGIMSIIKFRVELLDAIQSGNAL